MADVKISALPAITTLTPATAVLPVVQGTVTDKITVQNLMKAATQFTVPTLYAYPTADLELKAGNYVKIPTPNALDKSVAGVTYDTDNDWWVNTNAYDIDFIISGLGRFSCKCAGIKVILVWVYSADGSTLYFYAGEDTSIPASEIGKPDTLSFSTPIRIPAGHSIRFFAMSDPEIPGEVDTLQGGLLSTGTPASYFIMKQLVAIK